MSKKFKIHFPGSIDLLVKITDGKRTGTVTIAFEVGQTPTKKDILDRIARFEKEEMPDGFRLMNKRETWNDFCRENLDGIYAMPGGEEFDE